MCEETGMALALAAFIGELAPLSSRWGKMHSSAYQSTEPNSPNLEGEHAAVYYTCIIRATTCDKFLPSFCLVFAVITGMYAYHLEYHYLITTLIVFACGPLIKFYSIAL